MKKTTLIKLLLLVAVFVVGSGSLFAESESLACPSGSIVGGNTITFSTTNFTVVHAKGTDSNLAAYSPWRVYTKNTVTFTAGPAVKRITSVVITASTEDYATAAVGGTLTVITGTGSASGVASSTTATITVTGDNVTAIQLKPSAQTRWSNIEINYETLPVAVVAPAFSVPTGTYITPQEVELTCETAGASIFYTTNGTEPTNTSTPYTGSIAVNTTTTIKAIAYKDGNSSFVSTIVYTIMETTGDSTKDNPFTVSDLLSLDNTYSTKAWVIGYIIGGVKTGSDGALIAIDNAVNSAIAIAATAGEEDLSKMVPVQLPTGDIRTALNVKENAKNIGKQVKVYGDLEKYFNLPGVKNISDYEFIDGPVVGLNDVKIAGLYVADGRIHFSASAGEQVEIYNAVGQRIYQGIAIEGLNSIAVKQGIALVKVGNEAVKVLVK